jgi:hypothetical protein
MGALFEDQAGGLDGIAQALDTGHATGLHAAAVHEQSVKLNAAIGSKKAATARIESRIVFKNGDCCFNGVKGGTAARKNRVASFQSAAYAGFVSGCRVGGDSPCAAMNQESGNVHDRRVHLINMVEHSAKRRLKTFRDRRVAFAAWRQAAERG